MICWSEPPKESLNSPPNSAIPFSRLGKATPIFLNRLRFKRGVQLGAGVFCLAAWWLLFRFFVFIAPLYR